MDIFDYLAILGALAWLPPVIILIRNQFIVPNILIKNEREFEIGYTTFGPIINAQLAFLSDNKKALIEKIEIDLTHESNDTHKFTWDWFEEILYEVNIPNTGIMPTRKNQKAIAINLKKEELTDKKIGFQQDKFKSEQKKLIQNTVEEAINLEKAEKPITDLKSQKNYNDLINHYQHSFNWKTGNYTIKIKVKASSINKLFDKTLSFKLTALEVNNLQSNIDLCKSEIERSFIDFEKESVQWKWIYPTINE